MKTGSVARHLIVPICEGNEMKSQTDLDDIALLVSELTDAERETVLATADQFRIASRQYTKGVLTKFVDSLAVGSPAKSKKRHRRN